MNDIICIFEYLDVITNNTEHYFKFSFSEALWELMNPHVPNLWIHLLRYGHYMTGYNMEISLRGAPNKIYRLLVPSMTEMRAR